MKEFSDRKRLQELAIKWRNGTITEAEAKEFAGWYNSFPDDFLELDHDFAASGPALKKRMYTAIEKQLIPSVPLYKRAVFYRSVAAAVIILILGSAIYFYSQPIIQEPVAQQQPINAPGQNKAVLTLADGTTITLENAANGQLAQQGQSNIVKKDNELVYNSSSHNKNEGFNTVSLPKGSLPVSLKLSDGSRIWLNAASSITYPVVFNNMREVKITGEVYFEIAKNKSRPFIVQSRNQQIEVLGTEFNVNAYDDEPTILTTLINGRVRVKTKSRSDDLAPGEQSIVQHEKLETRIIKDPETAAAWKNNRFVFGDQADIESIMRVLSRWYNIEVQYHGKPFIHFGGAIPRNIPLAQVLKVLENTGGVHFSVSGRTVTVMP